MNRGSLHRGTAVGRALRMLLLVVAPALALSLAARPAAAQTLQPTYAIDEQVCRTYLGFWDRCQTVRTQRLNSTFARQHLGGPLYADSWSMASNCTSLSGEEKCRRSVGITSDVEFSRLAWSRNNTFIDIYGRLGARENGTGYFSNPRGTTITRAEGAWHVAYVADAMNDRVVALGLNSDTKAVVWLGAVDGSESGVRMSRPHDVSWDPTGSWAMSDDRLYVADTRNGRVLMYQANVSFPYGTPTVAFTYLGAVGTPGSGAGQLSGPQGIAVRTGVFQGILYTTLYVSDTGNQRVVRWRIDGYPGANAPYYVGQTAAYAGPSSEFNGIAIEHGGDILVADRAQNRVVKLRGDDLLLLQSYGNGTNAWASGSFNAPTDVVSTTYYSVHPQGGWLQSEVLPYLQTVEKWTSTTGGQVHRFGVDALSAGAVPGNCSASLNFLLTGLGSYSVYVRNASTGATVRSWPSIVSSSGWKYQHWDGKNNYGTTVPSGSYTFVIAHESGYTYDDGQPRYTEAGIGMSCFGVTVSAPGYIGAKGTYALNASAPNPADSWQWEASYDYGGYYHLWDYGQNSHITVYDHEYYDVQWRVSARRTADGVTGSGTGYTQVRTGSGGNCDPNLDPFCPMSTDPQPVPEEAGSGLRDGGAELTRVPGQGRRRDHYGSGAWVGGMTQAGPQVVQLFSLFGTHDRSGDAWPNPLGGTGQLQESRHGRAPVQVEFTGRPGAGAEERYRVRFATRQAGFRDGHVGIAIDPDLGAQAHDDSLGFDPATGLVWVLDPDSGALGYLVTGRPAGSRLSVRQFSRRSDVLRPDPASDSVALAELAAGESALTGKRDDVRFVIAVGSVALSAGDLEMGLVVFRAPTLDALRGQAARVVAAEPGVTSARGTGITRFRITQAPPQPGAAASLERISPNLIPGLSESSEERERPAPAGLRDEVRANGITALAFAVPDGEPVRVEVRIHDASGRLVRRLLESTYDPGAYRMQWDLLDEGGSRVAPGVYVAVMEAPGFRGTTRLVVVR